MFNLSSHLANIYDTYPEAGCQPVIGITANFVEGDAALRDRYYESVVAAGGTPVIIPPVNDKNVLINTLNRLDGLLLSGGADYNPLWGGDEPSPKLHGINAARDLPELLITQLAFNRQIPILGICRGMQTLAMALGGKVAQDISDYEGLSKDVSIRHSQDAARQELTHSIAIEEDSTLFQLFGERKVYVNSFHHQAVSDPGQRFRVVARAADGVIEGMESTEHKPVMGVQWHPEWLESGRPLFQWLVEQANNFHVAKELHRRILTLGVAPPHSHSRHPLRHPDVLLTRYSFRPSRPPHPGRSAQNDGRTTGRRHHGGLSAPAQNWRDILVEGRGERTFVS